MCVIICQKIKKQMETENTKVRIKNLRGNMPEEEKEKENQKLRDRMSAHRTTQKEEEANVFQQVKHLRKVDPDILNSDAFKKIQNKFLEDISEGPEYDCDICWKMCFKQSVRKLNPEKYEKSAHVYEDCKQNISQWICNSCHSKLMRGKMPSDAIANNLNLDESAEELTCLNDIEHALICQIMPFMSIVARHRGAQVGLKGQVVLVPADLNKIQKVLPRSSNDDHLISVALKRRLTDNSSYIKQHISPAKINAALIWLKKNNSLYTDVEYDTEWEKAMQESDPELWSMLTEGVDSDNITEETPDLILDSDSDDEDSECDERFCDDEKEQIHKHGVPYPTVIQDVHGPDISVEQIVDVAPAEGKIPINRSMEPNCEPLAFPKHFSTGNFHYNVDRKTKITPLKYFKSRVKCRDKRFAEDSRYIFFATDWVERDAIHNSICFSQRRAKQQDITVGQLKNSEYVKKLISDDEMYSIFKKIRGAPQFFKDMQLDVLAKVRYFGVPTFFMTWSAANLNGLI